MSGHTTTHVAFGSGSDNCDKNYTTEEKMEKVYELLTKSAMGPTGAAARRDVGSLKFQVATTRV